MIDLDDLEKKARWCPDVCPITGRKFFMWIDHWETGQMVPTYGGPLDSYTIPVKDSVGDYLCERYDHDLGGWLVDEFEDVGVQIVDSQLYVCEDDPSDIIARCRKAEEEVERMKLIEDSALKVCGQLDEVVLALPYDYLDPPDGGDVSLGEQVKRMYSEVKMLREQMAVHEECAKRFIAADEAMQEQLAAAETEIERLHRQCERAITLNEPECKALKARVAELEAQSGAVVANPPTLHGVGMLYLSAPQAAVENERCRYGVCDEEEAHESTCTAWSCAPQAVPLFRFYSTSCDEFEAAIKKFGIVAACEWFGHASDSEFTAETKRHFAAAPSPEGEKE